MADLRVLTGVKIVDADSPANSVQITASGELTAILAANSGVDIGDVDVTSLPTSPDTIADDAAFSGGSAVFPAGLVFDDSTPDPVDEGDVGYQRMSVRREAYQQVRDAAGNERGANVTSSNELSVLATAQPGVDIGDVDILSVIPGVGATNMGKAENAASAGGDTLIPSAAVQDAVLSALGSIDGDYTQLRVTANGALWVETVGASGGTSATDSDPFTVASDSYTPVGGIFDDITPGDLVEGDGGAVRMSAVREMYMNIRDGAGGERSANVTASNELNIIASAQPGVDIGDVTILDFGTSLTDADDDVIANGQTSLRNIGLTYGYDGTQWERIQTNTTGAMNVAVVSGGGESLPTNPVRTTGNSTDTAAAGTFTQDGPSADGTTTKVGGFDCAASVPIKAELQSVANGAGTTLLTMFAQAGERLEWRAPHRNFFSVAHPSNGGFDGFRLLLTNLDNENAADLYATLYTED